MTPRELALEERRKKGVKAIKAAQRALGLEDGAYRDLLEAQTRPLGGGEGKRSASELTVQEQGRVLDYMRKQGAAHPTRSGGVRRTPTPHAERAALTARVHALLAELKRVDGIGKPYSLAYCDAICQRNGWGDRFDFANPTVLHRVVGALSRTVRTRAKAHGFTTTF
jgi:hypothetical protein